MAGSTHTGRGGRSSRAAFICCVIAALASTACMPQAGALSEMDIEPIQVGPPGSGGMAPVQFMVGCWRGPAAGGTAVYEERFTPSAAGIMLGSSRMFSGMRLMSFEYLTVRMDGEDIVYLPAPGGRPSPAVFRLTRSERHLAWFEAPDHNYPRRIRYSLDGETMVISIDAGADDTEPRSWELTRVSCDS